MHTLHTNNSNDMTTAKIVDNEVTLRLRVVSTELVNNCLYLETRRL